ncbi:P-II family nitrogen regulator [Luteithermobacter gelatinilyticus]|uniref:P-II family nitrogen regulator n=1 Tax=Luteithermobacter gelatinilyticus TaxID=2582913 RepID=UPI0011073A06|nr:P-II family nitrogen regulator [Luteithermobacter gelatinilyticus]|tara:strand:+ start:19264 stop:19602 length:339 start_codon:yes stop_codon:yes gene_type:complete
MKFIIAIIKPFKLEDVREALTGIGVEGMTAHEVKGYGRQQGHSEIYRGAEYDVVFVPKVRLELAVKEGLAEQVMETVRQAAYGGRIGDGKIFMLDLEQAMRIRTGEMGEDAL